MGGVAKWPSRSGRKKKKQKQKKKKKLTSGQKREETGGGKWGRGSSMRSWTCPTIVLLIAVAVLPGRTRAAPAISLGDLDGPADVCYPETCSVPQEDTFFSRTPRAVIMNAALDSASGSIRPASPRSDSSRAPSSPCVSSAAEAFHFDIFSLAFNKTPHIIHFSSIKHLLFGTQDNN
ncbi:unnamed protein product [Caenorhabditis auriculariae]|uniref:Uncharacterized protein n=1 Tax=Caenorhabditis auriculariae TaxID=2777116 RepID=A0A8S1HD59_9PELO|nr:unnamed protein product [Caenorhabditis auriculariae]